MISMEGDSHNTTQNHSKPFRCITEHLGLEIGLTYVSITKDSNTNLIMDIIEERKGMVANRHLMNN